MEFTRKNKDELFNNEALNNRKMIGRNDLCYCGSGKKYKNCCKKKDEEIEILKNRFEQTEEITDRYFSVKEYIERSGYPVKNIDYFIIEVLNIAGSLLYKFDKINSKQQKELLIVMFNKAKEFIKTCETCENECIKNPMKEISFKYMIERGLELNKLPKSIQKQIALNFFYIEFTNYMANAMFTELKNFIDEEMAELISSYFYGSFLEYINDNCYENCNNECICENNKNAYCKFCNLGKKRLPCPKKEEIEYEIIKATPNDMEH
jgi:hypothetical protein